MPETRPPLDLSRPLDELAARLNTAGGAPVESWNPPLCGHSGIRIAADGRWWHEDRPITREALVRQFARILRREPDGSHALVTPHERLTVDIDDLPFVASLVRSEGTGPARRLLFALGIGEGVLAGPDHPIVPADEARGLPALRVRANLWARIDRASWIELGEIALAEGGSVWSEGACFRLA